MVEFDEAEFLMGMKEEKEHEDVTGGDPEKTAQIVAAHLREDDHYYTKLKNAMKEANVMDRAVKFLDEEQGIVEGLGIPYGGPMSGKDLTGEYFTAKTNLCTDWFPQEGRPALYHHGLDPDVKDVPIGRQIAREQRDTGTWVKAQLDKSNKYWEHIRSMVKAGKLFFSSGAVPHLVDKSADGEIKRWPWVELSLTPTPAHPGAIIDGMKAVAWLKAVGCSDETIAAIKREEEQVGHPSHEDHTPKIAFEKLPTQVKDDLGAIGGQEGGTPKTPGGFEGGEGPNPTGKFPGAKIVLPPEVVEALENLAMSVDSILSEHEQTQAAGGDVNQAGTPQENIQPGMPPVGGPPAPGIEPPVQNAPPPGMSPGMAPEAHGEMAPPGEGVPPLPEVAPKEGPSGEPPMPGAEGPPAPPAPDKEKPPMKFKPEHPDAPSVKKEKLPTSKEVAVKPEGKMDPPQDLKDCAAVKALLEEEKQTWTEGVKALLDQQKSAFEVTIKSLQEKVETLEKLPRSVPPHRYAGAKSFNPHMEDEISPEGKAKVLADLAAKATDPTVKAFLGEQSAMEDVRAMMQQGPVPFKK